MYELTRAIRSALLAAALAPLASAAVRADTITEPWSRSFVLAVLAQCPVR
jgi:hypothetical protein